MRDDARYHVLCDGGTKYVPPRKREIESCLAVEEAADSLGRVRQRNSGASSGAGEFSARISNRWCPGKTRDPFGGAKNFLCSVRGVGWLRRSGDRLVSEVEVTWCG
jgi:hypothetical protein